MTDAFTLDWCQIRGYAFPPFSLVGQCPSHQKEQNSEMMSSSIYMGNSAKVPSFTRTQCRFPLVTPSGHRDSQQGGVATPSFPPPTFTSTERGSELVAHDLRSGNYHPKGVEFNLPE